MKISYNWLKEYLNIDISKEDVSSLLTDIGLEVEGFEVISNVKGGLQGIVIGKIITKVQHPNADRLSLTNVDIGEKDYLQIVCGAPNVEVGLIVPVATVGTRLYSDNDSYKIKRSKIRGELSNGMICGEDEIGLGSKTDGIMVLDPDIKPGTLASDYFSLGSDIIFNIGLTPNRTDAMGHIGVARDLMTVLNNNGNSFKISKPSVSSFNIENRDKEIKVEVLDNNLCPRYSGVSISNISISESPEWLEDRLKAIGLNPVNSIVDITNYVLHETGQPLHAFDINKINGNKIIVSTVKEKTSFTTLDNKIIKLSSNDLMINDENKPMCIAGIFGGVNSSVTNQTTDIFLESAYFDPVSIRKTSKRHKLNTDASFRYERGCDPNMTLYALKRAALLISEICGGVISSEVIDIYPNKIKDKEIKLSYNRMDKIIGQVIPREKVKSILKDLEIKIINSTKEGLQLLVPPYRVDVQRDIDIIEEILRIFGFNRIDIPKKINSSISFSEGLDSEGLVNTISDLLSANGFNEVMNNSISKNNHTKLIDSLNSAENVNILNPLSQDLNILRQSLLFSGLENIIYNQNRRNHNIKIYEFGKTYNYKNNTYKENKHLQMLACGRIRSENWNYNSDKVDFYFIKDKVEHIIRRIGIKSLKTELKDCLGFSSGMIYKFKDKNLVSFGKIKTSICKVFGIKSTVYGANFDWDLVLELANYTKTKYQEISKYQEVRRDLSLMVDINVSFDELTRIAKKTDHSILKKINLFDVYDGVELPKDKKSYALSFMFEDTSKTLTDKIVDEVMEKLIKSFQDKAGAIIR